MYDLETKNYNDLIAEEGLYPKILILFVLPTDEDDWLSVTSDKMVLRRCAWWCSLKGQPQSSNKSTKRIMIPIDQLFTPLAATELMEKVKGGIEL